ncbi:MAG: glycosyl hydrolase [Defluviitaleaceae bacterium]|nr:glycosyl hydrolase [Defluviitaleaceae bacterium]
MKWIQSTDSRKWEEKKIIQHTSEFENYIHLTNIYGQEIKGFGACFNDAGYTAVNLLNEDLRKDIFSSLFSPKSECKFNICFIPIGFNENAELLYSHNEKDGDLNMTCFSIANDHRYLLPYIKESLVYCPEMVLIASQQTPPVWMKDSKSYYHGQLRNEPSILEAYALYLLKFIQLYKAEGVNIKQIHIPNIILAESKFPERVISGEKLATFIRDFLNPLLKNKSVETEIWLSSLNGNEGYLSYEYSRFIEDILFDKTVRDCINGVSYQSFDIDYIKFMNNSWPEIPLARIENDCGSGDNSWLHAEKIFRLIRIYLLSGVEYYIYPNMILQENKRNIFCYAQNSLITVNLENNMVVYNPEFYVMRHYSSFVESGSKRIETKGHWSNMTIAFENADGSKIVIMQNPFNHPQQAVIKVDSLSVSVILEARSFNTFIF